MDTIDLLPGAAPFFYPGNEVGCLLIHGFTGTPFEMRWLGEHLNAQGYTTYGPRLAGHGTRPEDMARVHWEEWAGDVLAGYDMLAARCDRVIPIGLSMGGALTLWLSAHRPVAALVTLSAVLRFDDPRLRWAGLMKVVRKTMDKERDPEATSRFEAHVLAEQARRGEPQTGHPSYGAWVLGAVPAFLALLEATRAVAGRITAPALLVHSRADPTVPFDNLALIENSIRSSEVQKLILERSGHVITEDVESEIVYQTVSDFINKHS